MSKIIIVVGCHTSLDYHDSNNIVYAFEPNPYLVDEIKLKLPSSNYNLIQKAIDIQSGTMPFYIHSDTYSSSLKHWGNGPQYGEFVEIQVDTIRLDEFIDEHKINKIDYLHIDAQGSDLDVLKSLGKYIDIVDAGVCESLAPNVEWKLYDGQPSFNDIQTFLIDNEFVISWESDTNGYLKSDEVNIYFKR